MLLTVQMDLANIAVNATSQSPDLGESANISTMGPTLSYHYPPSLSKVSKHASDHSLSPQEKTKRAHGDEHRGGTDRRSAAKSDDQSAIIGKGNNTAAKIEAIGALSIVR
jgi:hypothetical protein